MSIRIEDTISVHTPLGEYQIQLCYGDISKQEDKMDIVMVSAFPGDYAAVGGTLIGALKRNLGINVLNLSRNKLMDLRTHFSCWMSKDLDSDLPFKKLLCFERSRTKGCMIDQIRDMFRALVPACGSQETTLITPLLGTGNQGFSESKVLSCMVEAAANWMQAGLPLKCIKIVIYGDNDSDLNSLFSSMKKKIISKTGKKVGGKELTYDIYITYEQRDQNWVSMVTKALHARDKNLKLYTEVQKFDEEKIWQDNVFKTMSCSRKVIAILTPSFVNSKDCLDQFNMAMCCNRLKNSQVLFPFLLSSVESMPVYMQIVQYFDCRVRKEGDVIDIKIDTACSLVMNPTSSNPVNPLDANGDAEKFNYDVFISYSHRQPKQAEKLLNDMTVANSDLKIFFDRSELTMGNMWQTSLYESLDNAECIIALVSPAYFSSTVCQEEYNIALARHLAYPSGVLFIPVLVEPMETIPSHFSRIPIIDGVGEKFEKVVICLIKDVSEWRSNQTKIPYIQNPVDRYSFQSIENERKMMIQNHYNLDLKMKNLVPLKKLDTIKPSPKGEIDVAISFARDTIACAGTLNDIFCKENEKLQISFLNENTQGNLKDLDSAKQVIIILSKEYIQSTHHMQELHLALCRQRESKNKVVVRIFAEEGLPEKPMFIYLLPFDTVVTDKIWKKYHKMSVNDCDMRHKTVMSHKQGMMGSFMILYGTYYALQKTAFEVMESLTSTKEKSVYVPPIICNMVEAKLKDNKYPPTVKMSECMIDIFSDNQKIQIPPVKEKESTTEPDDVSDSPNSKSMPNIVKKTDQKENSPQKATVVKWADEESTKLQKTAEIQISSVKGKENTGAPSKDMHVVKWDDEHQEENTKLQKTAEIQAAMIRTLEKEMNEKDSSNHKTVTKSSSCSLL
ncbi:Hypothetical predicted protein [Mytilus galloprovincialis]|uniref:TIR domain-containing protein n=1 Tax=Mytilus galloprovincialis TaxID=29158 RepID=A0A8B6C1K1_MYTGA|nr:Hypothetical predicted protein [Mytilus galloprovincialis]